MTELVRLSLTQEQAEETHQALVERQARLRVDLLRAGSIGQYQALDRAVSANASVARPLADSLGYTRDGVDEAKAAAS